MNETEVREQLTHFVKERFELDFEALDINGDTNLYEMGLIDSLDSMILLTFIEKTYDINVSASSLENNALDSINSIVDLILCHKQ